MIKSKTLNWLLAIITFVSLPFGYYWYYQANKQVDPTFIVGETQQQIIDKSLIEHAPLKIEKASGEQVMGNVYIQKFYFFNQGKEAIKPDHILKPIFISLTDRNAEILDYKISKLTDSVTECSLERDSINKNRLNISFRILQEDDGFAGQLIYSSDSISGLKINGKVEGAKAGFSDYYKNKIGLPKWLVWIITFVILLSPLWLTSIIAYLLIIWINRKRTEKWRKEREEFKNRNKGKAEAEAEILTSSNKERKGLTNSIHRWLTRDYFLTISDAENPTERSSLVFRYQQVILFSVILFSVIFIVSLFLSRTYLKLWFDPRQEQKREMVVDPFVPKELR